MTSFIEQLAERSRELTDLHNIMALLQWDQETQLPSRATAERAEQFGTLSRIVHRKEVDPELGRLLEQAAVSLEGLSETEQALVRVMRRHFEQNTRLPEDFVARFSRLTSRAQTVWSQARQDSDFSLFAPLLEEIVDMCRQQADFLGYREEPYDALLDLYEEGLTTAKVEAVFAELKEPLANLVRRARAVEQPKLLLRTPLALETQVKFADELLGRIGYDFERGRQERSVHPFTTSLGHHDRRVTNRYGPGSIEFIFSALHEGGHALYEQGIADSLAHSALDEGVSLGIHEAQSRLWENIVGRSRPFWEYMYPGLQAAFPEQLGEVGLAEFVAAVNRVEPGPIRVEADEVSYNLHVLIRFELEKALLDGALPVKELPAAWNEKYRATLGVNIDSDAQGVLQDIHWSHGSLGYFPTYTIGNLAAAQFWESYCAFDPAFEETLRTGNLARVRSWFTENVYRHGAVYPPEALLRRVTGRPLEAGPFLGYLRRKFNW